MYIKFFLFATGTATGLSTLVGVLTLILCFTIIIVYYCKRSKKSCTLDIGTNLVDLKQSESQQTPLSQQLQSTDSELAEIFKEAAESIFKNSQAIKPMIFVQCLTDILTDASSKLNIHRSEEESRAFREFVKDMLQKSQSLIRLYTDGNLSTHCVRSSLCRVETDTGDDEDMIQKQIDKLKVVVESKKLVTFCQ